MQFCQIGGQRRQPRGAHVAGIGIDQQRRADLDDDAAEVFQAGRAMDGLCAVLRDKLRVPESEVPQLPCSPTFANFGILKGH